MSTRLRGGMYFTGQSTQLQLPPFKYLKFQYCKKHLLYKFLIRIKLSLCPQCFDKECNRMGKTGKTGVSNGGTHRYLQSCVQFRRPCLNNCFIHSFKCRKILSLLHRIEMILSVQIEIILAKAHDFLKLSKAF